MKICLRTLVGSKQLVRMRLPADVAVEHEAEEVKSAVVEEKEEAERDVTAVNKVEQSQKLLSVKMKQK